MWWRNHRKVSKWNKIQNTIECRKWLAASAQSLCLVRVLHQAGDLLHHSQRTVVETVAQLHFASVQHHVLIVVGSCKSYRWIYGREKSLIKRPEHDLAFSIKTQHSFCASCIKIHIHKADMLTRVIHGKGFGPFFSGFCQTVSQPDPLPGQ